MAKTLGLKPSRGKAQTLGLKPSRGKAQTLGLKPSRGKAQTQGLKPSRGKAQTRGLKPEGSNPKGGKAQTLNGQCLSLRPAFIVAVRRCPPLTQTPMGEIANHHAQISCHLSLSPKDTATNHAYTCSKEFSKETELPQRTKESVHL